MKFRPTYILLLFLIFLNCKSDKKEVAEPIVKPILIDTIPEIVADTTTVAPKIDSIPVIKKVEKIVEKKAKPKIKPTEVKPFSPSNYFSEAGIKITPIEHATMVLEYNGTTIYIDPVGGKDAFKNHKAPNFIIITDIHGDHMDISTLEAINTANTIIIGPKAVKEKLPASLLGKYTTIFNGLSRSFSTSKLSLTVEAVAMYNIRKEALKFHTKERGNGYILTLNRKRIYISGDTEDILEMRQLKNIDVAFICMNLPYTMTPESAASAVLQFKPKKVLPYHYRGTNGFSDVKKFKSIVNNGNKRIKVVQLNWYH